jgi:hypothetical protein
MKKKLNYFKETFSKSGSGLNTRVDESYVTKLLSYFKSRYINDGITILI